MHADLHVHSTASDGSLTPSAVVELAGDNGVTVLALADHDSISGIAEAQRAADARGLRLIPAVELSACDPVGRDVHLLGYFVDFTDPDFVAHLRDLSDARVRRAERMVDLLKQAGYSVTLDEVMRLSEGGSVGRSHIARALVAAGDADTVADAFQRLIGHGMPFYVSKDVRTPAEAIALVHAAAGLCVLAHPGVSGAEDLIPEFVAQGLDGIEAFHADHSAAEQSRFASIADQHGLLVTGGSDFHGPEAPNPTIGTARLPESYLETFLAAGAALG